MSVRRTLALGLAAPLLLPLLLSACGGGDVSVADPPLSSAPTSSPTSSTRESPEHFIRRFVSVSNAMEMGGSTKAYLSMTSDCDPCKALADQVSNARLHGGYYHSRGWAVRSISSQTKTRSADVDVAVTSARTEFRTSETAPIQHYSGGSFTFRIAIRRSGSVWKVTNVAQVAT